MERKYITLEELEKLRTAGMDDSHPFFRTCNIVEFTYEQAVSYLETVNYMKKKFDDEHAKE